MKMRFLFSQRTLWIILFIAFVFLRLFSAHEYVLLGSDHLKFFTLADRFPDHLLYNNQPYLLHPPFYPYMIHIFTLIFRDDFLGALLLSLFSSIATFFVLARLLLL